MNRQLMKALIVFLQTTSRAGKSNLRGKII